MKTKHWQDSVNAALGVWLLASAWMLGFQNELAATASATGVGLVLLGTALGAVVVPRAWEEWVELGLGMWLCVSPWLLRFTELPQARLNAVLTGLVITALALWVILDERHIGDRWHGRAPR